MNTEEAATILEIASTLEDSENKNLMNVALILRAMLGENQRLGTEVLQLRADLAKMTDERNTWRTGHTDRTHEADKIRGELDAMRGDIAAKDTEIANLKRGPTPDYTGEGSAWVPPVGARAVVVPELTKSTVEEIAEAETRVSSDGPFASREQAALAEVGSYIRRLRAIPADRVLGEGVAAVDSLLYAALVNLEKAVVREWGLHCTGDRIWNSQKAIADRRDALRANQGGADHD